MAEHLPNHAVAIVGMAGRFPGARDLEDFWRNIFDGVEILDTVSDAEMDAAGVSKHVRSNPNFVPKCTALEGAEFFDAGFFGMSPREAQILDPQQRIFLECAWEALENAGYSSLGLERSVGVYAGASMNTYLISQLLRDPEFVATVGGYQIMLGNDKDFLCTHVSYELDLRGPSLTIQTACSTSLVAVAVACQALLARECDMALAGGVSVTFPQRTGYLYEEGMIHSPDGHCRPFDVKAFGTRGGAGAGIVVLKRFADALADRDTIHAVIRGAAINNDGSGKAGYTAPSIHGQAEAVAMAQALAGVEPRSISYIEAHGTGTPLGDPIEIAALTRVFRESTNETGFCRIGSLKANLGHLDAAAGVASLIKTVLMLKNRWIPPLVNFHEPNPLLNLESSPFLASGSASPWVSDHGPLRAGVSSFGIGGTNAHVVLEEAPVATAGKPIRNSHLLVISTKTSAALEQATLNLANHLSANADLSLTDVAWTLAAGRQAFPHRRAVVVADMVQTVELLRQPNRAPVLTGVHDGDARRIAFLFSGQGSQHEGMGADLYSSEPVYREAIDRCAAILRPHIGRNICDILFDPGQKFSVNDTHLAQPLLFATEYALASLWLHWGVKPCAMLGHSIGEYVAAHLAGVMTLEDSLEVVAARGRMMQAMSPGSMAAIHCAPEELRGRLHDGVEIAAINAPELCTVSGPSAAIAELVTRLAANSNIASRKLHTSHAFHSSMMEPALEPFKALLERISLSPPCIPYISNVTGEWITPEQATSPAYYATHLRRAVQFEAGIRTIAKDFDAAFLEIGPGSTLTSFVRLIIGKERSKYAISSLPGIREGRADDDTMLDAAGRLWLAGAELDWKNLQAGALPRRVPLPTYPFERQRYCVEAPLSAAAPIDSIDLSPSENAGYHLFAPTWTRQPSRANSVPRVEGAWLLLARPGSLSEALANQLRRAGADPIVIEPGDGFRIVEALRFQARFGQAQDISAIVGHVGSSVGPIRGAVYLDSGSARDPRFFKDSYRAVVALAEGLGFSPDGPPIRIIVVTFEAESVLREPVRNPEAASVIGPVLVLPTEVPRLQMRAVDLELPEAGLEEFAAKALVEEAANSDLENLVAWRDGYRWMRRFERVPLPPMHDVAIPVKQRGVYLITGGLGGIGLTLARWFAAQASARLVLTARTPLPPRQEWDGWLAEHPANDRTAEIIRAIRAIEQAGSEVLIVTADAANLRQMEEAFELVRARWGGIDGVVHAAGIPGAGKLSFLKQTDEIQSVLSPKVDGLNVLVRLLGGTSLDFVVLMSSSSTVLGAPGLSDYTAANAVLDAFPDSMLLPAAWRHVVSINWGPWRDLGMAANLVGSDPKVNSEPYRRATLSPTAGTDAFAKVLSVPNRRVVVVPYDLQQHFELVRNSSAVNAVAANRRIAAPTFPTSVPPETPISYQAASTDTERRLAEIWSVVLGIEQIGMDDNFFDLGGHSLLATRVLARISELLHIQLRLRDIFDTPTIRGLAVKILSATAAEGEAELPEDREEIVF